jgi:hypothetical protein
VLAYPVQEREEDACESQVREELEGEPGKESVGAFYVGFEIVSTDC